MTQLNDLAKNNNVNLEECILFSRLDDEDLLAVNLEYVGIKQRQDRTMSINFTMSPREVKELQAFFSKYQNGERFYYDIARTGFVPVNFRGLTPVSKEVNYEKNAFIVSLMVEKAEIEAKDQYFEPVCECCVFHHI